MNINNRLRNQVCCCIAMFLFASSAVAQITNETQKLLPADGAAGDFFGQQVDLDGDSIIIGARLDDDGGDAAGAAYIFNRTAGLFTETQKLLASDAALGDEFGFDVSIDGDTAAIGVPNDDTNGANSGAVWIFRQVGGVWIEEEKIRASNASPFARFGNSISLDGDTLLVGTNGATAAYIFTRSEGDWIEQQELTPSDGSISFGPDVALDGETALVGAFLDDDDGMNAGAVYVFAFIGGSWIETQKLLPADGEQGRQFGNAVAIDDGIALIGASLDADNGNNAGAAYIFARVAGVWGELQKLTASDAASGDFFGTEVAVDSGTAVITANQDDDNGDASGSAYVFREGLVSWAEETKLLASDGAVDDFLGFGAAVHNGTAVIGARADDDNGPNSGSAYTFVLNAVRIDIKPGNAKNVVVPKSNQAIRVAILGSADFDALSVDVSSIGFGPGAAMPFPGSAFGADVNLDGFADLTVRFHMQGTGIQCGDTRARLLGNTLTGMSFAGTDKIFTKGCP